jgi:hypothetical protein
MESASAKSQNTEEGEIRLASLEDICAFKLDVICHRKEKKDYVDIAVLLEKFSFGQMLNFYKEKFSMNDKRIVLAQILDMEGIENSVEPVMLVDLTPGEAIQKIQQQVNAFSIEQIQAREFQDDETMRKISDLLKKKNETDQKKKGKSI